MKRTTSHSDQSFKGSNKHSPPRTILLQRNKRVANVQRENQREVQ